MGDSVKLIVESKEYDVSKKHLSERSEYFYAMFNGNFLERNKATVKLEGVTINSWEQILHFLDHGLLSERGRQCTEQTLELLEASTMLQIIDVQRQCIDLLDSALHSRNAMEILKIASRLDLNKLIRKARAIVLWNFDAISASSDFCNLDVAEVEGYLSDSGLRSIHSEWGVWEAIDRWLNYSTNTCSPRSGYLPRLIKCLHLDTLTITDLQAISLYTSVQSFSTVYKALKLIINKRCKEKVELMHHDQLSLGVNSEHSDLEAEDNYVHQFIEQWLTMGPRKLPLVPSVVANVYFDGAETPSPCVVKYSEVHNKLVPAIRVDKVESNLGSMVGFKIVSNGCKLYLVGGEMMTRQSSWNQAVWEYDQIYTAWTFLSNLPKPSRHAFVCCIDDDIYVMGGFGRHRVIQRSVEKFSISTRSWKSCAPLPGAMYSTPSCVFRGQIYVVESFVYQYTPSRDAWVTMNVLIPPRKAFSTALSNEKFIFITGGKNVYKLNPSLPDAAFEDVGTFENDCTQACLVDNYIYSLSQDEFGEQFYCEKINIATGESVKLLESVADDKIANLDPKHHHGCFPLLSY